MKEFPDSILLSFGVDRPNNSPNSFIGEELGLPPIAALKVPWTFLMIPEMRASLGVNARAQGRLL